VYTAQFKLKYPYKYMYFV